MGDFLNILLTIGTVLNIFFAFFIVFFERKNASVTWAWLMVVLIIPYFGFLIYLLLGFEGRKHRVFLAKSRKDEKIFTECVQKAPFFKGFSNSTGKDKSKYCLSIADGGHFNDMVYLNNISGAGQLTSNNSVKLFYDGNEKFAALFYDIKNAKKYIHLEYYIMHGDSLGRDLVSALAEKAREGVEVRLLIDGMGNYSTPRRIFKPLIEAGGKLAIFSPPYLVSLNYRNHRKLAVIDGKIGYIGGLNIGNEYLGKSKRFGYWRDTHIRLIGDAVNEIQLRFIMDWNFCKTTPISPSEFYFPQANEGCGDVKLQIVSSGPDTKWHSIQYAYNKMISEADKRIYIETPYFIPDDSILEGLRVAALSGIDVRIIIPAKPDHPFVYWAALSYMGELLEAGVRCYEYEKGFVHSKLMIIDGVVASVGTANMDVRSFKLNFESNAFIYDEGVATALQQKFLEDLEDCHELTLDKYYKRSKITKIKESVSRLISPIL